MSTSVALTDLALILFKSTTSPAQEIDWKRDVLGPICDFRWNPVSDAPVQMILKNRMNGAEVEFTGELSTSSKVFWLVSLHAWPQKFDPQQMFRTDVMIDGPLADLFNRVDLSQLISETGAQNDNIFFAGLLVGELLHSWVKNDIVNSDVIRRFTNSGIPEGQYTFRVLPVNCVRECRDVSHDELFRRAYYDAIDFTGSHQQQIKYQFGTPGLLTVDLTKGRQSNARTKQSVSSKKGTSLSQATEEEAELEL